MLHEPAAESGPDHAMSFKTKLGVKMFIIYALVYGAFVAIRLVATEKYAMEVIWGLNLAVVFGFGLIVFALALALYYNKLCSAKEAELNSAPATPEMPTTDTPASAESNEEGK